MYEATGDLQGTLGDFIDAMLTWDPEDRPSAKALLQHPWLRDPVLAAL